MYLTWSENPPPPAPAAMIFSPSTWDQVIRDLALGNHEGSQSCLPQAVFAKSLVCKGKMMQTEDWQKRHVLPNNKSMATSGGRVKNSEVSFHELSCWIHVPFAGWLSILCSAIWPFCLWQIYLCFLVNSLAAGRSLSCRTIIHHFHHHLPYLLVPNPPSQRG